MVGLNDYHFQLRGSTDYDPRDHFSYFEFVADSLLIGCLENTLYEIDLKLERIRTTPTFRGYSLFREGTTVVICDASFLLMYTDGIWKRSKLLVDDDLAVLSIENDTICYFGKEDGVQFTASVDLDALSNFELTMIQSTWTKLI